MRILAFEKYIIADLRGIWATMKPKDAITPVLLSQILDIHHNNAMDILAYSYNHDLLDGCILFKRPTPKAFTPVYIKYK